MTTNENKHFHKHLQYVVDKIHIKNSVHGLLLNPHSPHQTGMGAREGQTRGHTCHGAGVGGAVIIFQLKPGKEQRKPLDKYQSNTQQNRETNRSSSQVSMHTVPS